MAVVLKERTSRLQIIQNSICIWIHPKHVGENVIIEVVLESQKVQSNF